MLVRCHSFRDEPSIFCSLAATGNTRCVQAGMAVVAQAFASVYTCQILALIEQASDQNTIMPDFSAAIDHARRRLDTELPPYLHYHSVHHTFGEVLPASMKLAGHMNTPELDIRLLRVAAAFHDIGWIIQGMGHEAIGVEISMQVLPGFGFSTGQLDLIAGMIMATRLPQTPHNALEEILADADMYTLGSNDFWPRNSDLRYEMEAMSAPVPERAWYESQLEFLVEHRYHTNVARKLLDPTKKHYIDQLRRYLSAEGDAGDPWKLPPPA